MSKFVPDTFENWANTFMVRLKILTSQAYAKRAFPARWLALVMGIIAILLFEAFPSPLRAQDLIPSGPPQMGTATIQSLIDHGQFDRAEKLINEEARTAADPSLAYYWLGYLEFRRGKTFASIRAYRKSEMLHPHDSKLHRLLAVDYFLLGQRVLFGQEIQEALAENPKDEQAYYLAGRFAYEVTNDFEAAIAYFLRAVHLEDTDYKAQTYLGLSYKALGRSADAERQFKRACKLVKSSAASYDLPFYSLAECYLDAGQSELALRCVKEAIAIDPISAKDHYLKAKAELALGLTDQAVKSLRRSASLDPTYAQPYYLLARIYMRNGQQHLAEDALGHFRELTEEYGGD